ncbi:IclR family transcriptional regulator [Haliea salexigens]|jgi:DNA-binding IclR family transcriptional regulator|uniref:IclR family transcriptional regulator n=1 Tax=Haliea salexigens TaxID=287487 RepID=UPI0009FD2917|nr:helix-turn-helix domain-containing protein [Haliea salexigens]|tara:strand:+ start:907 stop:1806 length:900 start_codon:yes stop_codon:yes gene_type:complete
MSVAASPPTSRVIAVLEALATNPEGLSGVEIARRLDLSTSTLSLILKTLRDENYVERLDDRSYRLGFGVLRLLNGVARSFPLLGIANDELNRLHAKFGFGCTLARIDAGRQEVVLTVGSTQGFGITPGVSVPLQPPHGTIAMAWRSAEDIDQWLSSAWWHEPNQQGKRQKKIMLDIRKMGLAVYGIQNNADDTISQLRELLASVQTENPKNILHAKLEQLAAIVGTRIYTAEELSKRECLGVSHIIAPVFGPEEQPRYLISLHVMQDEVSPDNLHLYNEELLVSANVISKQIGGRPPTS